VLKTAKSAASLFFGDCDIPLFKKSEVHKIKLI